MRDSRGRDTSALFAIDIATGKTHAARRGPEGRRRAALMGHPARARSRPSRSPTSGRAGRCSTPPCRRDLDALAAVDPGELVITSRTLDDDRWMVAFLRDDGPGRYYLYDRATKKATFLFTNRKDLEGLPLVKMHPVVIPSRDGLSLVSYLSLPRVRGPRRHAAARQAAAAGAPRARRPLGARRLGLQPRAPVARQPRLRGAVGQLPRLHRLRQEASSTPATASGPRKMHDDLLDAVDWAVKEKIADRAKVAIMGGSYGGYATLVGLTFTPEVFACGVDIVGPSNLVTLLESIPPYWKPQLDMMKKRVGDHDHRGRQARRLLERSPLTRVDKIQRPLLIGQGANDPRVKQAEADQIVKAMTEKKIPVTYVLYPDEGHGFRLPAQPHVLPGRHRGVPRARSSAAASSRSATTSPAPRSPSPPAPSASPASPRRSPRSSADRDRGADLASRWGARERGPDRNGTRARDAAACAAGGSGRVTRTSHAHASRSASPAAPRAPREIGRRFTLPALPRTRRGGWEASCNGSRPRSS